jgi:ferrous iron transport protein B
MILPIRSSQSMAQPIQHIAIIGNPNCGKTTLFNALTGLHQKVGNYPGVTVEKKVGTISLDNGDEISVLDLPGTYSLSANSPDEQIVVDVLFGRIRNTPIPQVILCVVDATNLERNLYLLSQILDLKFPTVVALNMFDRLEQESITIDIAQLEETLGVRCIPTIASNGTGIDDIVAAIRSTTDHSNNIRQWTLPESVKSEHDELVSLLIKNDNIEEHVAFHIAQSLLSTPREIDSFSSLFSESTLAHVREDHRALSASGFDRHAIFAESRYKWIHQVFRKCVHHQTSDKQNTIHDTIDSILTHNVWGYVIFFALMSVMFTAIFTWANYPMELISEGFGWLSGIIAEIIPEGDLRSLIVNGVIGGVGAVVTFLPQILFLFLFLGFLEDTGYMSRAAFIMDRVMGKVGLHGKSFIPLLSSYACAIPGIMATRTIENPRDRLVTILVAPLMSCSARLPVYTLLIASFVPNTVVFGIFSMPALVIVSMYLLGLVAALVMALLLKNTILKGPTPAFMIELPPYRMPSLKNTMLHMWERSVLFLKKAGTIILGVSIILWFLATYPKLEEGTASDKLAHSFVGKAGHLIEPVIKPLGFDWKIGIGIISSLLQREVFVSTMGTIYNIENADEESSSLKEQLQRDIDPETGLPTFTLLTAICIMVYYVLAMQCLSTIAVVRRETNSWRWPLFQFSYMTLLAYAATFITYRVGLWIMS